MAATIKKSDVVTVILILGLLTLAEIAVPWAYASEYDQYLKVSLLVVLACAKAWLVALYFMHLKWEKPWLKRIAMMPLYIAVFACLLMIESVYR